MEYVRVSTHLKGLNQNTSFFRDHAPFECLKALVIPKLIKARKQEKTIRVWSAGCSIGHEPYSVAMVINNFNLPGWYISILATDIDPRMTSATHTGIYNDIEEVPDNFKRYFHRINGTWQIDKDLRKIINTSVFDLNGQWPGMPKMDIILVRHVLCHLPDKNVDTIIKKIAQTLRHDGYLFIGQGLPLAKESIKRWFYPYNKDGFRPVMTGKHCCYVLN